MRSWNEVGNLCDVALVSAYEVKAVLKLLLWCLLFVLCWPLAVVALVLYPVVWLLLLPVRIVGIAVGGVLEVVWAVVTLPARLVRAI